MASFSPTWAAVSGLGADHGVGFGANPDFMYLLILNNLLALVRNLFLWACPSTFWMALGPAISHRPTFMPKQIPLIFSRCQPRVPTK
jgi:hypothetical protein